MYVLQKKRIYIVLTQAVTAQQIEAEWPFKNLPKGEKGYKGVFAPDNGVINVQLLLRTLSRLAKTYGAHAEQHIQVTELLNVKENNESVWTVKGMQLGQNEVNFKARKVAITAGAYVNDLLEKSFDLKLDLNIWEMTASYWNINSGPNGPVFPSMGLPKSPSSVANMEFRHVVPVCARQENSRSGG